MTAKRMTISTRLTIWYGFGMLLMTILAVSILMAMIHFDRHAAVHQKLFAAQNLILGELQSADDGATELPDLASLPVVYSIDGPLAVYVRFLGADGQVLKTSPNAINHFPAQVPSGSSMSEFDLNVGHQTYRVMVNPVTGADNPIVWLETSALAWSPDQGLNLAWIGLMMLVILVFSILGGYFLSKRALKPISLLSETATSISPTDLSVRLPVRDRVDDEISRLTLAINSMLDRIQNGFDREKQLTADAAHEMMNPLAVIRTEAEVSLRKNRSDSEMKTSMGVVHATSERLSGMLSSLLMLSRMQSNQPSGPIDSLSTLERDWEKRAEAGRLKWSYVNALQHIATEDFLTVLSILVDNAFKYSPIGGSIRVDIRQVGQEIRMEVADTGIGIANTELGRIFDRFYRSERSEVMARPGYGLGLAIAFEAVRRNGGTLTAESEGVGAGCRFVATFPAVD